MDLRFAAKTPAGVAKPRRVVSRVDYAVTGAAEPDQAERDRVRAILKARAARLV